MPLSSLVPTSKKSARSDVVEGAGGAIERDIEVREIPVQPGPVGITGAAVHNIVAGAAHQGIVAGPAQQRVVSTAAFEPIVTGQSVDDVIGSVAD